MLNITSIMLGTKNPKVLGEFYEKVFNRSADMSEEGWYGWHMGSFFFGIGEHSEVAPGAKEPQRIILNLETKSVEEEFQRIEDLGAVVIKKPYKMGGGFIATFADPDGNYFQLMTPWEG